MKRPDPLNWPALASMTFLLGFWACVAGACSSTAPAPATALQDANGNAVAVTYPLAQYAPAFSAKVAAELKTAPPELAQVVVDYEKLRCEINPQLTVCKDLLK